MKMNLFDDIPIGQPPRLRGKYGWDSAGNCVWCGEAGRCQCDHRTPLPPQRQRVMFTGLDLLPGQQDLFETDGG